MSVFDYRRRPTVEVSVGRTPLGGDNPVRIQSMGSRSTMDTRGCVEQALRMADAGAEYIRFTAQGVREAENLAVIRRELHSAGCCVPLVADIHFNPRAAFAAASRVEKVRINPGNFVDPGRTFRRIEYTDAEYAAELRRIEEALVPFLDLCRENHTAIRIGVNHGSLSDRIMSRYGDTPAGMTESAMEFLRVCRRRGFNDVVISVKASNVTVMVETVRRLVAAMDAEDMHFPLHLGVTEAGDGEDGRVKSAVGIGTLLAEGIGDTIRVSLSEEPERELPVARELADYIASFADAPAIEGEYAPGYDHISPRRRVSTAVGPVGGGQIPVVAVRDASAAYDEDLRPDIFLSDSPVKIREVSCSEIGAPDFAAAPDEALLLGSDGPNYPGRIRAAMHRLMALGVKNPVILRASYPADMPADTVRLRAAVDLGSPLLDGFADGVMVEAPSLAAADVTRLAFGILQAARLRVTRTEYVSCPGCGRTLFDLQSTLARVKEATSHLSGLKIGVMGCIVNGPGEMADADYGYVGAAAGHISLYKGKECVEKNIPAEEAVEHLVELIKRNGDWK